MQWVDRIGRRLKLRDLHIFLTVTQQGSMGKAAAQLAVSQPVVSKAIADMEHAVGVRLLDRSARGVEPTLYGRSLLKWGAVVFDDRRQSMNELEHLADPAAGELRIGAPEGMMGGLLPELIDRISRRFPRIAFYVIPAPAVVGQYQALRDRKVEIIVGRMPTRMAEEDIECEPLFDEQLFIVAGVQNRWARRRKITLPDLANEPWCLPPTDTIQGSLIVDAFRASGLGLPSSRVSTVSLQLHMSLLLTGRYLALLPTSVLHFCAKEFPIRALPVELPRQPWPLAIATLKRRTISPVAQLVIDCARELAKDARKGKWCG
jgi:DNA-binding transcriptional LysR family regulator